MKPLNELTPQEIGKWIDILDKAMFSQPIEKQRDTARAIGILIKAHQAKMEVK